MPVCRTVVPPEVLFADGVRVACHLHPPGQGGGVLISAADVVARRSSFEVSRAVASPAVPGPAS